MGDPAAAIESATAVPVVVGAEDLRDGSKSQSANKKKSDSGSGGSFFTWFMVLALLGVWTSVAVVYFDLVDYQGVLDEGPGDASSSGAHKETFQSKEVGWKLREALKQQLAAIHQRVEAKKLAKLALAEVRLLLAKEEAHEELELGRKEMMARVKQRVAARLQEEEEKMETEEREKAVEEQRMEKARALHVKREEETKEGKRSEGKEAQEEVRGRGNEKRKKGGKTAACDGKGGRGCDEV